MDLAGVLQRVPAKLAGVEFALCQAMLNLFLTNLLQHMIGRVSSLGYPKGLS